MDIRTLSERGPDLSACFQKIAINAFFVVNAIRIPDAPLRQRLADVWTEVKPVPTIVLLHTFRHARRA
jgi:hypothetical protein